MSETDEVMYTINPELGTTWVERAERVFTESLREAGIGEEAAHDLSESFLIYEAVERGVLEVETQKQARIDLWRDIAFYLHSGNATLQGFRRMVDAYLVAASATEETTR